MILCLSIASEGPPRYRRVPEIFACKMQFKEIFVVLAIFLRNVGVQADSRKE